MDFTDFQLTGVAAWVVLGALSGWLASVVIGARGGFLSTTILGIIGAVAADVLMKALNMTGITGFNPYSFLLAAVGATAILILVKLIFYS